MDEVLEREAKDVERRGERKRGCETRGWAFQERALREMGQECSDRGAVRKLNQPRPALVTSGG